MLISFEQAICLADSFWLTVTIVSLKLFLQALWAVCIYTRAPLLQRYNVHNITVNRACKLSFGITAHDYETLATDDTYLSNEIDQWFL